MILPSLLLVLAGAPKAELGIVGGLGYMPGEAVVAPGRDDKVVDAVRNPWSAGAWFAYQWVRGHELGLRYQYWRARQKIDGLDDYDGGEETLEISIYGVEYVRLLPFSGASQARIGGGCGYAKAADELELEDGDMSADGDGWAGWARGSLSAPLGNAVQGHLGLSTSYIRMAKMKSKDVDVFESDYLILQAEIGVSFGL